MYQPEAHSIALLFMGITLFIFFLLGLGSIAIAPTVTG
jgi:hypothetical protein